MSDIRHKWFSMLANLTYPLDPGQAATAFKPYLALLSDMPDAAFTRGSLEAVCEAPHKMALRSYDEISVPLRAWWKDNRPFVPALPAPVIPDRIPPTQEVLDAVAALTKTAIAALVPPDRSSDHPNRPPAKAATLSDGALLVQYEAIAKEHAFAPPGSQQAAFRELAKIRVATLKAKLGYVDELEMEAAE